MRSKDKFSWSKVQENWLIFIIVLFSITVAFLDFSGILDSIPVIKNRVPVFTLLLLATLTSYVVFVSPNNHEEKLSNILRSTTQINDKIETMDSLKEVRVRTFKDFNTCLNYLNRSINSAKDTIYGLYWDPDINLRQVIARDVVQRELILIDETNRAIYHRQMMDRLRESGRAFSCGFLKVAAKDISMQYVIIDSNEIIFISNLSAHNISIRHPHIAKLMGHHYDEIWQKSIKAKRYESMISANFEKVLAEPLIPTMSVDLEKCVRECLKRHDLNRISVN